LGGGTCLLLGYNLNRPSTDLDLYTDNLVDIQSLKENTLRSFKEMGIKTFKPTSDGKENRMVRFAFKYFYKGDERDLTITCTVDKEKLKQKKDIVKNDNVYMFSIDKMCLYKMKALLDREKSRDIYDIGFLIHNFPDCFSNNKLINIKERIGFIENTSGDLLEKLFKDDDVMKRYNAKKTIEMIYIDSIINK
jgi:predicted nucleotidyltransferase component of viral defense system